MLNVTTPADSYDLTTLAAVRSDLSITSNEHNETLLRLIAAASAAIADHCHRVFAMESVTETLRPDRLQQEIILTRYPVTAITSIVENDTVLDAAQFEFNPDNGIVTRLHGNRPCWWPHGRIVVAYTAGYTELPPTVERACVKLIQYWFTAISRDPLVKAVDVEGVGSRQYWVGGLGDGGLPPEVIGLLAPYRTFRPL